MLQTPLFAYSQIRHEVDSGCGGCAGSQTSECSCEQMLVDCLRQSALRPTCWSATPVVAERASRLAMTLRGQVKFCLELSRRRSVSAITVHCEHYRQASACSCDTGSRGLLLVHFDCMASIFFRIEIPKIEIHGYPEYTLECTSRIFKMIVMA